jgi:lysophospholipase L1-like esterase
MIFAWLLFFFVFSSRLSQAQIPLYYQLLEAYQPTTNYSPPKITLNNPQVLGATSPSPLPQIGGDGHIIKIAVFGDSMIETLGPDITALKNSLKQYFPQQIFSFSNFGQSSTTLDKAVAKLPEIIAQQPDIVVIESFAYNNYGNTQSGFDKQWQQLSDTTSKIKNSLPKAKIIIASTVSPNSIVFGNGIKDLHLSALDKIERTSTIKLYLQNAINFATSLGFPLADAYHPSLNNNDGSREFISSTDNLHPSASGATLFADVLADTIFKNKLLD